MANRAHIQSFDPDMVARLEASGWKAYYDHNWFRSLLLIMRMAQEQFHIPFPQSVQAGYYIARGMAMFAPAHSDPAWPAVREYIRKFYTLAAAANDNAFDPDRVAGLELDYWVIHRQLNGQPDKTRFIDILAELHAAIFGGTPASKRPSAENRVLANNHIDRITGKQATDLDAEWHAVYACLRRCYEQIKEQL